MRCYRLIDHVGYLYKTSPVKSHAPQPSAFTLGRPSCAQRCKSAAYQFSLALKDRASSLPCHHTAHA